MPRLLCLLFINALEQSQSICYATCLKVCMCAGLVAQQQCCGPYQLPVADVAVMAQSHQGSLAGVATSIGEQPIKGLLDPAAMARVALAEALSNLCFASTTGIADIRASVNWMHAAKVPHHFAFQ